MKMITFAFRNRFSGLVRAILAILAGIALIVWPDKSLDIIVKVIAVAVVASGIFSLILGIIARRAGGLAVPVLNTIVTILVGVLLFGFSGEFALSPFGGDGTAEVHAGEGGRPGMPPPQTASLGAFP